METIVIQIISLIISLIVIGVIAFLLDRFNKKTRNKIEIIRIESPALKKEDMIFPLDQSDIDTAYKSIIPKKGAPSDFSPIYDPKPK